MPVVRVALCCILLCALAQSLRAQEAAQHELTIEGLDSLLEEAVRSGLTLSQYRDRQVSDAQLERLMAVGEEEIVATLEAKDNLTPDLGGSGNTMSFAQAIASRI